MKMTVNKVSYDKAADNVDCIPERYAAATKVAQNVLDLIKGANTDDNMSDYNAYIRYNIKVLDLSGNGYENKFKLANFEKYAKQVCETSGLFKETNDMVDFFKNISTDTWKY